MKLATNILGIFSLAILLAACNQVEFRKTSAGIPYKVFSSSKGDSVHVNYIVKYHVIQKVKDSVMTNTYRDNNPIYEQVQELTRPLTYADIRGNVMELLPKLKKGDSLYIVQSTDSLINANPEQPAPFKKGQEIVTTIRIVDVYKTPDEANAAYQKDNEPKMKEAIANAEKQEKTNLEQFRNDTTVSRQMAIDNKIIEDYLASHHIQATKTDWGVYIQIKDPGTGEKPTIGKFANVKYSGKHLNGEVFDAGVYPIQIGTGGAVKGFEEGIRQLATGGKATIYIPSMLAYGITGREPKIKPNEILVFDLEVLGVSDKPIKPQAQAMDTSAATR